MKFHDLTGSLGTAIVVGGYIHQVARLARTHRAENVSATAHLLWAFASGCLLVHAMGMQSVVFTVLMVSETVCCVLIAAMATIYRRFGSSRPAAAEVQPSAPDRPQP